MEIFSWLAEQRIQEAMTRGEFQNLPGHGKPLEIEDLSGVPEDLRVSYKLMKNAGVLPEELTLRAECVTLEELLAVCRRSGNDDSEEERSLERRLSLKRIRLQELLRQRGMDNSAAFQQYGDQIRDQMLREDEQ
ncbi:molecular chaperone DnaJ [Bacillus sp. FJAT-27264]|uniref:DnaJ family domain-containing protein n=1 Tax=Paenibacillus sp. (strain DSM 101736 / FJAT-27264) TaxID=1850362 RepID=UPI000807F887|nr:DnaJ family domain-containing protein [Bacillus sp. FJAT-27264]OBZ14288.1 molecular chaperone DnaJ [Bacillus sp. FJAT-27264]